jgi:NAD(P)-dependent dehydrogenase (short-subunit alcohol dehydrogenase family)
MVWVNLLSIDAVANLPNYATFSASKPAAYSLSQSLRAQLQLAGIRVVNVFPGPIADKSIEALSLPQSDTLSLAEGRARGDGAGDCASAAGRSGGCVPGRCCFGVAERGRVTIPRRSERDLAAGR